MNIIAIILILNYTPYSLNDQASARVEYFLNVVLRTVTTWHKHKKKFFLVWQNTIWCIGTQCSAAMQRNALRCSVMQYSALQCRGYPGQKGQIYSREKLAVVRKVHIVVKKIVVQCNAVQSSAIQCSAV